MFVFENTLIGHDVRHPVLWIPCKWKVRMMGRFVGRKRLKLLLSVR